MSTTIRNEPRLGLTAVAWHPPTELSFAQWAEHGRRLGVMGRSAGWWIGDWLAYGNAAYGERYARAARITGYDVQTLMNMVYVASHVDPSRRRQSLSWSHHAEVVTLSEEDQDRWLDRAEQERFSVRDLRQAIRDERRGLSGTTKEAADDDQHGQRVVCPSCGQIFVPEEAQRSESAQEKTDHERRATPDRPVAPGTGDGRGAHALRPQALAARSPGH